MAGYLLDSGVVSSIRVSRVPSDSWIGDPDLAVAEVVFREIMRDLPPDDPKYGGNLQLIARLPLDPLPAGEETVEQAERLVRDYSLHQPPLATNDALIAAAAFVERRILVTKNRRDFHYIRGLRWIDADCFHPSSGPLLYVRAAVDGGLGPRACCSGLGEAGDV